MSQDSEYLTCQEIIEFLWAYVSQELPPERVVEFERHLAVCPSCVDYLDTYRQTIELTQASLGEPEDEGFPDELVQAILAARKREE